MQINQGSKDFIKIEDPEEKGTLKHFAEVYSIDPTQADFWDAEITRHREMDVTGLAGLETERIWNGTSTGDVEKSKHPEGGTVRSYDMTTSAIITNVVRGVPRAENPYPKSGTITRTIHAVRTVDGVETVRDVVATITFDGDSTATMTVDGESWEIDLEDGNVKNRFGKPNG